MRVMSSATLASAKGVESVKTPAESNDEVAVCPNEAMFAMKSPAKKMVEVASGVVNPPVRVKRPVAVSAASDRRKLAASSPSRVPVQSPVASSVTFSPEQLIPPPATSEQSKDTLGLENVMPVPPVRLGTRAPPDSESPVPVRSVKASPLNVNVSPVCMVSPPSRRVSPVVVRVELIVDEAFDMNPVSKNQAFAVVEAERYVVPPTNLRMTFGSPAAPPVASVPHEKFPLASVSIVSHETRLSALYVPPVNRSPFANVDVAVVDTTLSTFDWSPPANVEVPVPLTCKTPACVVDPVEDTMY